MLKFRNLEVTPDDPVEQWGVEGILTAFERGGLVHAQRITRAALADPSGPVAEDVLEVAGVTDAPLAKRAAALVSQARQGAAGDVRRRVQDAISLSGGSLREFASQLGTSASRLSTYATGKVAPSAPMFLKIEQTAKRLSRGL